MAKAVGEHALGVRTDCVYVAPEEEAAAKKRLIRAGFKFGGVGFEAVGSLKIEHKESIGRRRLDAPRTLAANAALEKKLIFGLGNFS